MPTVFKDISSSKKHPFLRTRVKQQNTSCSEAESQSDWEDCEEKDDDLYEYETETERTTDDDQDSECICKDCYINIINEYAKKVLLHNKVQKVFREHFSRKERKKLNRCTMNVELSDIEHTLNAFEKDQVITYLDIFSMLAGDIFSFSMFLFSVFNFVLRLSLATCCFILALILWLALAFLFKLIEFSVIGLKIIFKGIQYSMVQLIQCFKFMCTVSNILFQFTKEIYKIYSNRHFYNNERSNNTRLERSPTMFFNIDSKNSQKPDSPKIKPPLLKISSSKNKSKYMGPNVDRFINKAQSAIERKHFSFAVQNLCISIEQLLDFRPLSQMKHAEKCRLAKLYAKRAECNLELAKIHRSERNAVIAIEDCDLLLETDNFRSAVQNSASELNEKLKKIKKTASQLKNDLYNLRKSSSRTFIHTETDSRRHKRIPQINESFCRVDAKLSTELVQSKNTKSNIDQCPICFTRWCEFVETKVVAILPCRHFCCAECLLNFFNISSNDSNVAEAERCVFGCPLCRYKLSELIFEEIARVFTKRRLLPSINFLAKKLPFSQDYLDHMIISLLAKTHCFDLSKVEYSLFNMIGLVDQNPEETLNAEKKQQFYEEARAPVKRLHKEMLEMRAKLLCLNADSDEAKEKRFILKEINKKLQNAIQNASRDIYERINSKGNCVIRIDDREIFSIDLHGLHISEAKEIINEFVLPVLDVAKQIMIITGRGLHSQHGRAVLKEAVREYFTNLTIRCEDVLINDGALYVYGRF